MSSLLDTCGFLLEGVWGSLHLHIESLWFCQRTINAGQNSFHKGGGTANKIPKASKSRDDRPVTQKRIFLLSLAQIFDIFLYHKALFTFYK